MKSQDFAAIGRVTDKTKPFSIRFTDTEKATLEARADGVPLGTFIKRTLLDDAAVPRRIRQSPVRDGEALGRVLGLLGQSGLASNFNQLVKQANCGALICNESTRILLNEACEHVRSMRFLLLQALGKEILAEVSAPSFDLTGAFNDRAAKPGDAA